MIQISDFQKIGVGLVGFGIFFILLGVTFFFDKALLAIGNLLFVVGLVCVIGVERTIKFFFQKHKWKGSLGFATGVALVLVGWPLLGIIIEAYGFVLLFGGFFPVVISFLKRVPIIGTILYLPGINKYLN
ncbi:vesicle transport protein GOT1B-like isoform X2 [Gordionus sp. m RMFG-2023]|uniref:vesicle transport protein GOT1B-like isoform X2 n=1 Tax=Gordionus sp. m RMFG-2023 TaxID=3053472 RepID=UPI0031FC5833